MKACDVNGDGYLSAVSYTRGTDLSGSLEGAGGIGGLLARSHGYSSGTGNWSTHNFYHADGNGNITYLVNSGQTVAASYRYDPYGNTISSSGGLASDNTYRFSSKMIHVISGLNYYGYRFYEPNFQRWVNHDPIGEGGGANLYGFVWNSPTILVDLLGLAGKRIIILITIDDSLLDRKAAGDAAKKQIADLNNKLEYCCSTLGVKAACGVKGTPSLNTNIPGRPSGGYRGNPFLGKTIPPGTVPVIITSFPIIDGDFRVGIGSPGGGVVLATPYDDNLSHELGHVGGYREPSNTRDPFHSGRPNNLMNKNQSPGQLPDTCWCEQVAGLAK